MHGRLMLTANCCAAHREITVHICWQTAAAFVLLVHMVRTTSEHRQGCAHHYWCCSMTPKPVLTLICNGDYDLISLDDAMQ